jgi:hypothetical protein
MDINVIETAKKLFNETWDLIDLPERSAEQNAEMLHLAHASRYLWGLVGQPVNFARGEWLISRVYAILGAGDMAILHGKLSLEIAEKNNLGGIDLPFGFEAVARAYSVLGGAEKLIEYKTKGLEAAAAISDASDREYVEGELKNIK